MTEKVRIYEREGKVAIELNLQAGFSYVIYYTVEEADELLHKLDLAIKKAVDATKT